MIAKTAGNCCKGNICACAKEKEYCDICLEQLRLTESLMSKIQCCIVLPPVGCELEVMSIQQIYGDCLVINYAEKLDT